MQPVRGGAAGVFPLGWLTWVWQQQGPVVDGCASSHQTARSLVPLTAVAIPHIKKAPSSPAKAAVLSLSNSTGTSAQTSLPQHWLHLPMDICEASLAILILRAILEGNPLAFQLCRVDKL